MQVVVMLLALRLKYGHRIVLLRGNHEERSTNRT
jgi:hypothetical protein